MNKETFAKYICDPSLLDNDTLTEIKAMLDEFPYFQSAWVLYIKNLYSIKDIRYESKLKTACAYVSDRKHLHDILKGSYIPSNASVQTRFIASPSESEKIDDSPVEPQNIVAQNTTEEIIPVQAQSIASPSEIEKIDDSPVEPQNIVAQDKTEEIIPVQAQSIASPSESKEIDESPVEPQNIVAQDTTEEPIPVQAQSIASPSESKEIDDSPVEPQNIVAQDKTEEIIPVQTRFIASYPESQEEENPEIQKSDISATITEQDSEESSNPQIFEPLARQSQSSNLQIFESSNQEQEPPAPLSIADRILMQMEEMRKAKAVAASTENLVKAQFIASPTETKEIKESPVETQNLASQYENEKTESNVETQNFASQKEDFPIQTQEEIQENSTPVQTQFIASQQESQEDDEVQAQFIASPSESQEIDDSSVETQNIASHDKTEEIITPPTQSIAPSSEASPSSISQQQIKEAIEKQLLSLGINANITFTNGSANIQFENFELNTEKEEAQKEEIAVEPIAETTEIAEKPHEEKPANKSNKRKKMDLIDQFLVSEAKITPIKNYHSNSTLSTESLIEDEELFSEKLAKIYIKQGHLEKALTTYEKLYLKYPEKSIYFATQIEYVKRLINK